MSLRRIEAGVALVLGFASGCTQGEPGQSFTMAELNAGSPGRAAALATHTAKGTATEQAEQDNRCATQTAVFAPFSDEAGASDKCVEISPGDTVTYLQQQGFSNHGDIFVCNDPGANCDRYTQSNPPSLIKPGQFLCEPGIKSFQPGNPFHHPSTPTPHR
jgi:hypothetical protein